MARTLKDKLAALDPARRAGIEAEADRLHTEYLTLQELLVGGALNLDQVRHLHRFGDPPEGVADALLAGKGRGVSELAVSDGNFGFGLGHSVFPMRQAGQPALNAAATAPPLGRTVTIGFGVHPRLSQPGRLKCRAPLGRSAPSHRSEGDKPGLGAFARIS